MTRIDRFQYEDGTHSPLSNFYPSPFELDGHVWPTVEHYFQAMKTVSIGDLKKIRDAESPGAAKRLGRNVELRREWEEVKLRVMRDALTAKFDADAGLRRYLLDTGDAMLVEGNTWHDQVWGNCTCDRHLSYPGANWLGVLLMARRAELRSGEL